MKTIRKLNSGKTGKEANVYFNEIETISERADCRQYSEFGLLP